MEHPGFFERAGPFKAADVAKAVGADLADVSRSAEMLEDVRALSDAGLRDLSFIDNRKYLEQLATAKCGACLVAPALMGRVPQPAIRLLAKTPYRSFALALGLFYPAARITRTAMAEASEGAVHASARLEEGVRIEPGAVIGREASIGRGTTIAAGAVIGYRVHVGRDSYVGPGTSLTHALVGDRVIIHAGVRIGQDGFGFAMGAGGHLKVPQIGRVIVQDDVEIGANTAVDRGALKDTVIGQGTKIDNLVQIGHNVVIGRHCIIVGQVGIAGSSELGDFVVIGGHGGVAGHIKVGAGAQIAGAAHVIEDVPAGARMAGTPARPFKEFARENAMLRRLAQRGPAAGGEDDKN